MSDQSNRKTLTRGHDRKLGGVASGIAEYFDIDPTLVRVLWVLALFVGPIGFGAVVAYLVMWVVMPAPRGDAPTATARSGGMDPSMLLGVVILAVGLLLLMRSSWVWVPWLAWGGLSLLWPALLVLLGAYIILSARRNR